MEKTIEVIATIWVNTESDRPPTILKSRPLVRCKDCVYRSKDVCMMWSCDEDREMQTVDEGYCHLGEEKG